MKHILSFVLLLAVSLGFHVYGAAPTISHQAIKIAPRSQPLSVVARVQSPDSPVNSVVLHVSQSADASPVNIGMKQTAPGTFLGTIPANYLAAKGSIRYYIEAANEGGDWAETPWYVISVQDPGESTPAAPGEEGDSEKPAWVWPTVLIGGGALAVAGAVALADSGGGGGGGDDTDKGGSGDGNISDRLLVRTATGQARTNIAHLPDDTTVDASATLGTRKIVNIRVDFTYDPADQGEEEFQVLYKGNPVISTGYTTTAGSRTVTLAGEDAAVTFRVLSSTPGDDNFYTWNWSGTVTYILDSGGSK